MRLTRAFFAQDTVTVARELLGTRLVRREADGTITAGVIVETEAYCGYADPACHSYKGSTERTRAMFGPKGHAYIYLIYGMYNCFNITSGPPGEPEAVLIRALEPVEGIDLMEVRRGQSKPRALCSGPGKLCMAMDIDRSLYGTDLVMGDTLYLETGEVPTEIVASRRINIEYAGEARDYLWRFTVAGSGFVSVRPKVN
ncbi:MAG: DNA-3-methyladenine glycosylase [Oscillospiraceae bacterium]|nr:DNA-3-methyladenine glycosylase [Oscillospiraceae bacterium]